MNNNLKRFIAVSILFLIFGGIANVADWWHGIFEVIKCFFPVFFEVEKMILKDYLTSPYFITGAIMVVASVFGIWFGKENGKTLFCVVSFISGIVSLISILMNVM